MPSDFPNEEDLQFVGNNFFAIAGTLPGYQDSSFFVSNCQLNVLIHFNVP